MKEKTNLNFSFNDYEEKLTKEEAWLYQSYASSLEGIGFSEQASRDTYKEAEQFLQELKEKRINWLGIDWGKLDFNNISQTQGAKKRIGQALEEIKKSTKDKKARNLLDEIRKQIEKSKTIKSIVAGLAALLVFAGGLEITESKGMKIKPEKNIEKSDWGFDDIYTPYINLKKGDFSWKAILEPIAFSFSKDTQRQRKIEIDIPYEYARLFDVGQPLDEKDYNRLNNYIKQELLKKLGNAIVAFSFDKKTYKKKHPNWQKDLEIEVSKIDIIGVASPEAQREESVEIGMVDPSNITLSKIRDKDAQQRLEKILKELNIPYDNNFIKTIGYEDQFSEEEMDILLQIAKRQNIALFDLIKKYNDGDIDPQYKSLLDEIIANKRKVIIYIKLKKGGRKVVVIPVPFLPLLLPFLPRRKEDIIEDPPSPPGSDDDGEDSDGDQGGGKDGPGPKPPLPPKGPRPPIIETDVPDVLPQEKLKELKEAYSFRVSGDVIANFDFYKPLINSLEKAGEINKERLLNALTYKILKEWEKIDNRKRKEINLPPVNYLDDEHQKMYAYLHAKVIYEVFQRRKSFWSANRLNQSDPDFILRIRKITREIIKETE